MLHSLFLQFPLVLQEFLKPIEYKNFLNTSKKYFEIFRFETTHYRVQVKSILEQKKRNCLLSFMKDPAKQLTVRTKGSKDFLEFLSLNIVIYELIINGEEDFILTEQQFNTLLSIYSLSFNSEK